MNTILEHRAERLAGGSRIETRGFGALSLRHRKERVARNPQTGARVLVPARQTRHFEPGRRMRESMDTSAA